MLETMFYRPQGLFDQLNSLHQALTRSLAADGLPDAIRSVGAGSYPGVNVGRPRPWKSTRSPPASTPPRST